MESPRQPHSARDASTQEDISQAFKDLHLSGIPHEWNSDFVVNNLEHSLGSSPGTLPASNLYNLERQAGNVLRAISVSVVSGQHMLINVSGAEQAGKDLAGAGFTSSAQDGAESKQSGNTVASDSLDLVYQIVSSHANVSNGIVQLTFSPETTCDDLVRTARMGQIFIAENIHLARPRVLRALGEIISLRKMPLTSREYDSTGEGLAEGSSMADLMPSGYMCIAVCRGEPLPFEIRELFMISVCIDSIGVLQHAPLRPGGDGRIGTSNGYQENRMDRLISGLGRLSEMVHVSNKIKLYIDNVLLAIEAHPVIRKGPSRKKLSVSQRQSSISGAIERASVDVYIQGLCVLAAMCANECILPHHAHSLLPDLISHRIELHSHPGNHYFAENGTTSQQNAEYARVARSIVETVVRSVPL